MKRWLGWTLVLGLGGALATGCVSRQTEDAQQSGQGGSGLPMPERWQNQGSENVGPYQPSQPQPIPRERRPAPLGVGSGPDNARKQAIDQLKH